MDVERPRAPSSISFQCAIAQCVANSLDAGASAITVTLLHPFGFIIHDNGIGIEESLLNQFPHCSPANPTPKPVTIPLGRHCTAFASICSSSATVHILTRHASSPHTQFATVTQGKLIQADMSSSVSTTARTQTSSSSTGTIITVSDFYHDNYMKRRALQSTPHHQLANQCRDIILQLAMIRPSVSFTLKSTLYTATTTTNGDHDDVPFSRNDAQTTATILHLPAGRSSSTSIAAFFFGESTTTTTAVPSHNFITISTSSHNGQHPFSVKGYTALPPYGHPNTSRQLIYLDGRSISAPRVTSMIDSLFLTACRACNKAGITVKGRQLLSIKAALNMKPMYVLHLRSSPSSSFPPFASTATATAATAFSTEYPLQEEVAFKDWNVAIEMIEKAILTAWAPCLPISLIDKLQNYHHQQQQQQQEVRKIGGGVGGGRERSRDAAHNRRNDDSSTKRHQRQQQQQPQEQLRALTDGDIIIMGNKKNSNASSSSNNNNNTGRTWSGGYTKLSGQASAMASRPRFIAPLLLVTEQVEKGVEKRGGGKGEEGYRPMSRLGQRHGKDALVVGTERRTASAPAPLSGNPKKRRKERSPKEGGGEGGVILVWPQRKPSSSEGGGGGGKNKSTGSKGKSGSGLAGEQQQQQQQQLHKVPPMKRTSPPPPLAAMNTKRTKVDVLFSSWKNPAFPATNTSSSFMVNVPNIDSLASSSFMTTTLKPPRITRDNLKHCEILNQVDCKFILARDGDVVFAVDQHAADERVRLESLKGMILGSDGAPRCDSLDFNHYSSSEGEEEGGGGGGGGGKEGGNNNSTPTDTNNATSHYVLSSMPLDRPTPLDLAPDEGLLLETYHGQVTAWGWKWRTKMTTTKMFWELTHVPVLLGSTYFTPTDLKLYLHQLQATCGANALPPVAVRVLNSKACRSAIMFGDTLDEEECREVLVGLRETRLYEICAHGRPTVVGLVDLGEMERALRLVGGADGGRRSGGDGGVNGGVGGGLKAKLMADLESGGKRKKNGSGLP